MQDSLEDILSDEDLTDETIEEPKTEPEAGETPELEEPAAEVEDPSEPEVTPKPEPEEPTQVPLAALQEERRENKALRAQLQQYQQAQYQAQQPQPQAPPDVLDDPQGYAGHVDSRVAQTAQNIRLDMSEEMARNQFGDAAVDAAFQAFSEEADPATKQAILASRSPWSETVKWHKQKVAMAEIGDDPDAWKQKERERIKAELSAELSAKAVAENVSQVGNAPSLATEPNLGSRAAPSWGGPASLDDILRG